jgi:hypothetical protein
LALSDISAMSALLQLDGVIGRRLVDAEDIRVLRFRLMVMTKALDPNRPIREADISCCLSDVRFVPEADIASRELRRRLDGCWASLTAQSQSKPDAPVGLRIAIFFGGFVDVRAPALMQPLWQSDF